MNKKLFIVLLIIIVVALLSAGGWYYSKQDDDIYKDYAATSTMAKNQENEHQINANLLKGAWDLLEKNVEGPLSQKIDPIDLSKYQIIEVTPTKGTQLGNYTQGTVDIVMKHRESNVYDWLSVFLLIRDGNVMDATIQAPDYFNSMKSYQSDEQPQRVIEFVSNVYTNMNPFQFGYRYRNAQTLPDLKWNIKDVKVIGQHQTQYLVEVKYDVEYAETFKKLTSLLFIREYEGDKLQVEEMKVMSQ